MAKIILRQYKIDLSINNIQLKESESPLDLLKYELNMRSHLTCSNFRYEQGEDYCDIFVTILFWGFDESSTGRQVAEELSEVVCAIYSHPVGITVKIHSIVDCT